MTTSTPNEDKHLYTVWSAHLMALSNWWAAYEEAKKRGNEWKEIRTEGTRLFLADKALEKAQAAFKAACIVQRYTVTGESDDLNNG